MQTEKHDLTLPEQGSTNWHVPLNENFRKLDEAAILQVPTVERLRADYTPSDQTFAFVEETREFWSGTGTEWVRVGYVKQSASEVYVQSSEPTDASEGDVWIVP